VALAAKTHVFAIIRRFHGYGHILSKNKDNYFKFFQKIIIELKMRVLIFSPLFVIKT
jgi:hypothetical protein